jgi:hypothetical protein
MMLENVDEIVIIQISSAGMEANNTFDANGSSDVNLLSVLWLSFDFVLWCFRPASNVCSE